MLTETTNNCVETLLEKKTVVITDTLNTDVEHNGNAGCNWSIVGLHLSTDIPLLVWKSSLVGLKWVGVGAA